MGQGKGGINPLFSFFRQFATMFDCFPMSSTICDCFPMSSTICDNISKTKNINFRQIIFKAPKRRFQQLLPFPRCFTQFEYQKAFKTHFRGQESQAFNNTYMAIIKNKGGEKVAFVKMRWGRKSCFRGEKKLFITRKTREKKLFQRGEKVALKGRKSCFRGEKKLL